METDNGTWLLNCIEYDDPACIHTSDKLAEVIETIGFLPLFSNEVAGFSVEEMTAAEQWWSGDPEHDPWEWRAVLARRKEFAYGKFFNKKAGFISKKWFPYFANCRRDGYDFDARFEDGRADYRQNLIMQLFLPGSAELSELSAEEKKRFRRDWFSHELKAAAGFGKGGEKNFDGTVAKLQMETYLTVSDFRQKVNKQGESYGWAIAIYTLPEYLWGYRHVTRRYNEAPEASLQTIIQNVKKHFKDADEKEIRRVVK